MSKKASKKASKKFPSNVRKFPGIPSRAIQNAISEFIACYQDIVAESWAQCPIPDAVAVLADHRDERGRHVLDCFDEEPESICFVPREAAIMLAKRLGLPELAPDLHVPYAVLVIAYNSMGVAFVPPRFEAPANLSDLN